VTYSDRAILQRTVAEMDGVDEDETTLAITRSSVRAGNQFAIVLLGVKLKLGVVKLLLRLLKVLTSTSFFL
jgi:hypothetical protein